MHAIHLATLEVGESLHRDVEKDYYVTLLLSELSTKQSCLPAYFKGGTALYKALGQMKRFSRHRSHSRK
jgi:predicted nucleotidyltransferase component of viral defense system